MDEEDNMYTILKFKEQFECISLDELFEDYSLNLKFGLGNTDGRLKK